MTPGPVEVLVRDRAGIDPRSLGPTAFAAAVAARRAATGCASDAAYAGLAASDAAEWDALLAALVVPETWFFRGGRPLFDALAAWLKERAAAGPVRVLCVPCSTGEEPLSLAVVVQELGGAAAAVTIDGWDISPVHLAKAVAGRYAAYSFRETDAATRDRSFREVTPGWWEANADVRGRVRFERRNLVGDAAGGPAYDLIVCRNLFIYLTPDARRRAVTALDARLAPGGRLCVSPAEASRLPRDHWTPDGPGAFLFYKRSCPETESVPPASRERQRPEGPARPNSSTAPRRHSPPPPTPPVADAPGSPPAPDPLAAVRDLADRGRLVDALAACVPLTASRPSADAFGLLGVVHLALGDAPAAAAAFRKALYLDPGHAEALEHLAVLSDRAGDAARSGLLRHRLRRAEGGGG